MDRLTKRDEFNTAYIPVPLKLIKEGKTDEQCREILEKQALDRLCEYEDKIERGELVEAKTCEYYQTDDDSNLWECSNCDLEFTLLGDNPKDNEMDYCPKCEAKIIENRFWALEDDKERSVKNAND